MILAQTATEPDPYGSIVVAAILAMAIGLTLLPAYLAYRKGRSFWLWFLFAFFCWVPAMAASLLISNQGAGGKMRYNVNAPAWSGATGPTRSLGTAPPPGWYPDPNGKRRERYWNGDFWSDKTR